MTFKEIKEVLDELNITPRAFDNYDFDEEVLESKVGKFKQIYQFGGEGKGDNYEVVYYFEDHDVYIEMDAYYSSYDGCYWDDSHFYEVKPKQVIKTVYYSV